MPIADFVLEIAGLGIIMYSESAVSHIKEGEDYLTDHYNDPADVIRHVYEGTLVGFCTASPGRYRMIIIEGYPDDERLLGCDFRLRLGIKVDDNAICFRDLYDLLYWTRECPDGQTVVVDNGIYEITLCSDIPESGIIGDNQVIEVYLVRVEVMPRLKYNGVPLLHYLTEDEEE